MTDKVMKLETPPSHSERVLYEKIGNSEWELREVSLNVHDEVALWADNPRLQTSLMEGYSTELELEEALRESSG